MQVRQSDRIKEGMTEEEKEEEGGVEKSHLDVSQKTNFSSGHAHVTSSLITSAVGAQAHIRRKFQIQDDEDPKPQPGGADHQWSPRMGSE